MNKKDLIEAVRQRLIEETGVNVTATLMNDVFDVTAGVIKESLRDQAQGGTAEVVLPGLGKLQTGLRAARMGRNPQTGAEVEIPARVTVKLRPSKALRDAVNGEEG